jgi:hypothetical protein
MHTYINVCIPVSARYMPTLAEPHTHLHIHTYYVQYIQQVTDKKCFDGLKLHKYLTQFKTNMFNFPTQGYTCVLF